MLSRVMVLKIQVTIWSICAIWYKQSVCVNHMIAQFHSKPPDLVRLKLRLTRSQSTHLPC